MTGREMGSARPDAHEPFEELAVGHALSSLEPDEEQVFLAHLPACAACQRAVVEHGDTLAHLAYASGPATPPASLLTGIRAGVAASGRAVCFPEPVAHGAPVSLADWLRRPSAHAVRRIAAWTGVAAAAALVVTLGVANSSLQRDNKAQLAKGQRLASTVQMLVHAGSRSVPLSTPGDSVQAVAVLDREAVSLVVDGLAPNNRRNSTYVLWEKSAFGDVRAVGTFDVLHSGVDVVRGMRLHSGPGSVQSLLVTHEPSRTAPDLTTQPPVVAGVLTDHA